MQLASSRLNLAARRCAFPASARRAELPAQNRRGHLNRLSAIWARRRPHRKLGHRPIPSLMGPKADEPIRLAAKPETDQLAALGPWREAVPRFHVRTSKAKTFLLLGVGSAVGIPFGGDAHLPSLAVTLAHPLPICCPHIIAPCFYSLSVGKVWAIPTQTLRFPSSLENIAPSCSRWRNFFPAFDRSTPSLSATSHVVIGPFSRAFRITR